MPYYMQYYHYKSGEQLGHIEESSQPRTRRIHRAQLQHSIKEPAPEKYLHLQKHFALIHRNATLAQTPRHTLCILRTALHSADIIIGCDGIKSGVRRELGLVDSPN
jgi:salicylate hydroxylase